MKKAVVVLAVISLLLIAGCTAGTGGSKDKGDSIDSKEDADKAVEGVSSEIDALSEDLDTINKELS